MSDNHDHDKPCKFDEDWHNQYPPQGQPFVPRTAWTPAWEDNSDNGHDAVYVEPPELHLTLDEFSTEYKRATERVIDTAVSNDSHDDD